MKALLILASFGTLLVSAEPPHNGYGTGLEGGYGTGLEGGYGHHGQHGHGGYGAPPVYGPPGASIHGAQGFSGASIGAPLLGQHAAPIIHKHVYVHVPPPEPYFPRLKKPFIPLPPPQKHYKIIFIKAPTPPPIELPDIPIIPPAPETKTLVYVLTKKPEPTPQLNIPIPPPPIQHKPDVYFIRYKTPVGGGIGLGALDGGQQAGGGFQNGGDLRGPVGGGDAEFGLGQHDFADGGDHGKGQFN